MALEKGYTCFTVSGGDHFFGLAAMKKFDYQVTPETCKPNTTGHPCKIYIHHKADLKPSPAKKDIGKWTEHANINILPEFKLGHKEYVQKWKDTYTIDQLKQYAVDKLYTCITVFNGVDDDNLEFSHAGMLKFDYQLTPEECQPIQDWEHFE